MRAHYVHGRNRAHNLWRPAQELIGKCETARATTLMWAFCNTRSDFHMEKTVIILHYKCSFKLSKYILEQNRYCLRISFAKYEKFRFKLFLVLTKLLLENLKKRFSLWFTTYKLIWKLILLKEYSCCHTNQFSSFVPNAPFLYSLKTSENLTIFRCF